MVRVEVTPKTFSVETAATQHSVCPRVRICWAQSKSHGHTSGKWTCSQDSVSSAFCENKNTWQDVGVCTRCISKDCLFQKLWSSLVWHVGPSSDFSSILVQQDPGSPTAARGLGGLPNETSVPWAGV